MNNPRRLVALLLVLSFGLQAQSGEAEVSYLTKQHVYLKLGGLVSLPDSLRVNDVWLKVIAISSQSIVLENKGLSVEKGALVRFSLPEDLAQRPHVIVENFIPTNEPVEVDTDVKLEAQPKKVNVKKEYRGYLSSDYYGSFNSDQSLHRFAQRINIAASQSDKLNSISFSARGIARAYFNSSETPLRWNLYELNARYANGLGEVHIGRSVPRFAASLGALDGVIITLRAPLNVHILAGYRPNYQTFGFDLGSGIQGFFLSLPTSKGKLRFQSSLGWTNFTGTNEVGLKGIDRQILYQQFSANLLKNLTWYSSIELDTYSPIVTGRNLRATGVYASLTYNFARAGNLYISYDSRGARVFYQQFDAAVEQALFDMGIQQGFRVRYSHKFGGRTTLGVNGTLRSQSTVRTPFAMIGASIRYRVPWASNAQLTAQFSVSKNAAFSNQIGQLQFRGVFRNDDYYRVYARYMGYYYPGSIPMQSDRFYFGGELVKTLNVFELFTRIELSYRAQRVYPGVQVGMSYRFNSTKKR